MYGVLISYHTDHICPAIDGDFTLQRCWILAVFIFIPFAVVEPASCFKTIVAVVVITDIQGINIKWSAFFIRTNGFCYNRCFCVAILVNNNLHGICFRYLRSFVSPYRIDSYRFCYIFQCCFDEICRYCIWFINGFSLCCAPTFEYNCSVAYWIMGRILHIIQSNCTLRHFYSNIFACAAIHVICQLNGFFHRFIFCNVNSQIRIRNPANLICAFGNCYSVVTAFFDENFNFTAGFKSFIFCQYDFGNVICSYTSTIGGVPEIINGFISTQTISICKIFLAVKTNLFGKISF